MEPHGKSAPDFIGGGWGLEGGQQPGPHNWPWARTEPLALPVHNQLSKELGGWGSHGQTTTVAQNKQVGLQGPQAKSGGYSFSKTPDLPGSPDQALLPSPWPM